MSAGGVTFMGLTVDSWGIVGIIVGITITLLTYATNIYFKRKTLLLAQKTQTKLKGDS